MCNGSGAGFYAGGEVMYLLYSTVYIEAIRKSSVLRVKKQTTKYLLISI